VTRRNVNFLVQLLKGVKVRFKVLTAARMKMAVFCVVAPCSLVGMYDVLEQRTASKKRTMI
jgi:hypothetical protein